MSVTIGKYTYGADNLTLFWEEFANLKIGKFCSFGNDIKIYLGGNHRIDWITTYPFGSVNVNTFNKYNGVGHPKTNGDVIIGNDVWIGNGVTIMSGVVIGDGAVIAANSHVVQKVKPYSVVGGNPAEFYYFRFSAEKIKKLCEIKWWDLDDITINEISPILCSEDLEKLFLFCDTLIKNHRE